MHAMHDGFVCAIIFTITINKPKNFIHIRIICTWSTDCTPG